MERGGKRQFTAFPTRRKSAFRSANNEMTGGLASGGALKCGEHCQAPSHEVSRAYKRRFTPIYFREVSSPLYGPPPHAFHKTRATRDLIASFALIRKNDRYDPFIAVILPSSPLPDNIPPLGNASLRAVRRLSHVSYPFSLEKRQAEAEAFRQDGSLGGICASSSDSS